MTRLAHAVLFPVALLLLLLPGVASAQWETPSRAFHKAAVFPLEGRHMDVPCASCHIKGQVRGTPTTCADCHWIRRQDDKYRARLGMACEQCHRPTTWTATKWDHGSATGTPLNIAHKALSCDTCHKNSLFTGVNLTCGTCHAKDYAAARTPDHKAAGFPTTCELCHRPADATFTQGRFDHNVSYPLVGLHATVDCASCHRNGIYKGTPRDCVGCHRADFERTTQPNHATAGFSTECATCHRPTDPTFGTGHFNHNTAFQLVGLHATAACVTCHTGGIYKGTARDCAGCHRTDYQRTTTPNHAAAGFSTACESCHRPTDTSWGGSGTFNHNSVFQLVGRHATEACATCHVSGVFKGTPRDCVGCHRDDYQKTTAPNHAASGFSTTCESCHKATDPSWGGAGTFNHASVFQLVGTHAAQACTACHVNNVFKSTPRTCTGCHLDEYQRTVAPNHTASGFSTTCDTCHRATDPSWRGGSFNHNTVFQLLGRHANVVCGVCHVNNVYRGTARDCVGCHRNEYDRTASPSHVAARFPTTCEVCHLASDATWTQGRFTHTWFPITSGKHSGNPCSACHTNPANYTQFTCLTCHGRTKMDDKHRNRAGYAYDSNRCYACHPNGRGD